MLKEKWKYEHPDKDNTTNDYKYNNEKKLNFN